VAAGRLKDIADREKLVRHLRDRSYYIFQEVPDLDGSAFETDEF